MSRSTARAGRSCASQDPQGREIVELEPKRGAKTIGLTELFFEGSEPPLVDVSFARFLELFPQGQLPLPWRDHGQPAAAQHRSPDPGAALPGQGGLAAPRQAGRARPGRHPLGAGAGRVQPRFGHLQEEPGRGARELRGDRRGRQRGRAWCATTRSNSPPASLPSAPSRCGTEFKLEVIAIEDTGNKTQRAHSRSPATSSRRSPGRAACGPASRRPAWRACRTEPKSLDQSVNALEHRRMASFVVDGSARPGETGQIEGKGSKMGSRRRLAGSTLGGGGRVARRAAEPFDEADIFFELMPRPGRRRHVSLDAERGSRITRPRILRMEPQGSAAQIGLTELFFEGEEPSLNRVPFRRFLHSRRAQVPCRAEQSVGGW